MEYLIGAFGIFGLIIGIVLILWIVLSFFIPFFIYGIYNHIKISNQYSESIDKQVKHLSATADIPSSSSNSSNSSEQMQITLESILNELAKMKAEAATTNQILCAVHNVKFD